MRMFALILACLVAAPAVVPAAAPEGEATLGMLDGWQTASGDRIVAMRIELAPGWKTYWRSPGDAGVPPKIDWSGSQNLESARMLWPRPHIYDQDGLRTLGFKHELVLPLELTPKVPGHPIRARGVLKIGVCSDVCIPVDLPFRLDASGPGGPDPAISAALAQRPKAVPASALPAIACSVDPLADGVRLTARLRLPPQGGAEAAVFEHADAGLWISEAQLTRKGDRLEVSADLVPPDGKPFALDRSGVRLTVVGSSRATEIDGCPAG